MQFKHQALALAGIFFAWVFIINIVNTSDLDSDEARHASQGLIIKAYVERIMDQGYVSYRTFLDNEFTARYPLARFYGLYDPPLHAMILAMVFSVFDPNIATARLGSQAIIGLLLPLLFLFMKDLLGDPKTALGATALFLLLPPVFLGGRQVMLTVPVAILSAGWYYFTFRNGSPQSASDTLKRGICGGLCLAAASLMMYQTLVYVPLFMVAYTVIEISRHGRQLLREWKKTVMLVMLIQAVIVALLVPGWFQVSFSKSNIFSMISEAGTQEIKGGVQGSIVYWLSFIGQLLSQTYFVAILAVAALLDREWIKRHWPLILFISVALCSATLMLSNRQLRYVGHIFPGIVALMFIGAKVLAHKMGFTLRQSTTVFVGLLLVLGASDVVTAFSYSRDQGVFTTAYDYLATQPSPRTVLSIEIDGERDPYPYMHTMDTIMFNLMAIDRPGQTAHSFDVSSKRGLAVALDQIDDADLYIFAFGPALTTPLGKQIHGFLTDNRLEIVNKDPY
ncbi:MAG TPA: glycosyltransferase family 39 protein, partial [Candidatus Nanoarchaeia archaeon]|nr:glycosyltransferase family 39 protein [Candidatus Nanoarchaeia archaeon]